MVSRKTARLLFCAFHTIDSHSLVPVLRPCYHTRPSIHRTAVHTRRMSDEVILYDLPSKQGKCWSLNPWKTRLVLNLKGIPYKTEWTEYPDLQPKFEKFGIPPNSTGWKYTSPTIRLPDGTYVMDSHKIAAALERLYPDPPLLALDSPYQARVEALSDKIISPLRPIFMPLVPKIFLNPRSQEYFVATREKAVGMSLDKYHEGAEEGLDKAKPYIKELGDVLSENPEGPFVQGKEGPIYADLVVISWLRMLDGLGWVGRVFDCEGGQELKRLYDAGAQWAERDSY